MRAARFQLSVAATTQACRQRKIRYVGCSNFSGWHQMKSLAVAERYNLPRHVAHQAYYSLANREYETELMPLGLDQGVSAIVWSPLASGRLTGKIRRGLRAERVGSAHEVPGVDT
jgi:aryl-alcohol dehydrogenase-like predicted oxidoreductase